MTRSLAFSMTGMTTYEASDKTESLPTCYQAAEDFHTKGGPPQLPGALEHTVVVIQGKRSSPMLLLLPQLQPSYSRHRYDRSIQACPVL
jgi:hypothetical protein